MFTAIIKHCFLSAEGQHSVDDHRLQGNVYGEGRAALLTCRCEKIITMIIWNAGLHVCKYSTSPFFLSTCTVV